MADENHDYFEKAEAMDRFAMARERPSKLRRNLLPPLAQKTGKEKKFSKKIQRKKESKKIVTLRENQKNRHRAGLVSRLEEKPRRLQVVKPYREKPSIHCLEGRSAAVELFHAQMFRA